MKTAGIIGGLGPETTSQFYLQVCKSCQQECKTQRPHILISSVPLSYAVEKQAITKGRSTEKILPLLIDAAETLETAGADFIVMPCNSLHMFIEDIRRAVSIQVLSIVEETVAFLKDKRITRAGVVSTALTRKKKLYETALQEQEIVPITPNVVQQKSLSEIIHRLVLSTSTKNDRTQLEEIIESLQREGVEDVVLACTDLQLLAPTFPGVHIYDSMSILANATVREILHNKRS